MWGRIEVGREIVLALYPRQDRTGVEGQDTGCDDYVTRGDNRENCPVVGWATGENEPDLTYEDLSRNKGLLVAGGSIAGAAGIVFLERASLPSRTAAA
jgi:hypothetical protein